MNEDDRARPEDEVARRARAAFDESVEALDAATLSRLNRSRHAAIERAGSAAGAEFGRWAPLTGLAAAALVAAIVLRFDGENLEPVRTEAASDFELLLETDDFEMLEDLEFYSWMDLEEDNDSHVG